MTAELKPNTPITQENVRLLKAGDWLKAVTDETELAAFHSLDANGLWAWLTNGLPYPFAALTYIGPDLGDGWIGWGGGPNPVPGMRVEVRMRDGIISGDLSGMFHWFTSSSAEDSHSDIIAFRPALAKPAEGEVDIGPMNMGLVRSAIYSVITDAVFGALKADGEVVTGEYGRVWDACNAAAETLMNGKCPQVSAPDRPYTDAFATPTLPSVDWERVGPKLVEALEAIKAGGSWQGDTASDALAAAQPEGK